MKSTYRGRGRGTTEIMMTPMIDVIFLLLIFFLTTSGVAQIEMLLPGAVSSVNAGAGVSDENPPQPTEDQLDQVVIKVKDQNGAIELQINGVVLSNDELATRFQAIFAARPDVPVIIDPDPKIKSETFVRVYDMARVAGLGRVYLATHKQK